MNIAENNDELVMKLLRYFITEKNYNPIVIRGIEGEIWLENLNEDYKIVRIVSNYIHNDAQFEMDIIKTRKLMKMIKKKTYSLKINALSIFVNTSEYVHLDKYEDEPKNAMAVIKDTEDLNKYNFIIDAFPDISKNMTFKEKGMELFLKLTDDIAKKNEGDAKMNAEIFSKKKPIITWILIAINVLMYIITVTGVIPNSFAVSKYSFLLGNYYCLFTGMFLHANIFHLLFNCYALYIIGMQLENFLGKGKYLTVYLLSGLAGSALSVFMSNVPSVGASGAIFGLMGALIYFGYHYRVYLDTVVKSQIIPLVVINLIIGLSPNIDNWAHIGGLIGGILSTMAVGVKYKSTKFEMINGALMYTVTVGFLLFMTFYRGF